MAEDIKEILTEYKEETKRHFDVVAERLEDKITGVAEQVVANSEDITVIKDDVHHIKDDIEIIKLDIEFIKNDLKQKVGRDEFVVLEKRVSMLEAKTK
ncbi:MAG: hypothetical protein Q8N87_02785 [bacterium]|nr:hypothetical protein [bacterium]